MDQKLTTYATRTVPRYTSYPTAPHFEAATDGATYAEWLGQLPETTPVSLYLHVPYCRSICRYCGCHTKAAVRDDPVVDYAEVLAAEIDLLARHLKGRRRATHIHWGGGTPSLLPAESLRLVVQHLNAAFDIGPDAEHAMELDPRTVTEDLAARLVEAGINRASLGVQDFTPKVMEAIGRIQPYEVVADAVARLRAVGIEAINFDLMYGLPFQTGDDVERTTRKSAELKPSRIAIFGYAHVPWFKVHQRLIDVSALPGAVERMEQAERARMALEELGYVTVGFDHFAHPDDSMAKAVREGTLKRNFQGYTTDTAPALIGFGASAIGKLPQGYVQNAPDVGGYKRAVLEGGLPIARFKTLSDDDRLRADIIEALMTGFTVDVEEVCGRYGVDPKALDASFDALVELVRDGLATVEGWTVTMKPAGRPFVRIAAAAFDAYLNAEAARHSVAV
ncbi:MAG TPA: oxygen-independent coproporphyrinogen III oxidase [Hyphomicrobiales bacterium]|nr:oxygen-independent coproporphyrinogen III oxidase [Kaistiaceae bacterium]HQF30402.1 oxygen-independent coproporphyrinogen III oxidase [Hyphomicrobiales bacterium]